MFCLIFPLSCAAFPFSFCSVWTLPHIMRSLSLFLLFCLNSSPYHAQPFSFPSVLSELYLISCAAFLFSFCSVWTLPLIMRSPSLFLLFCLNSTSYHAQPFPFPSVLSVLHPLSCATFPFSFCSVWTSSLIMCSLSLFLQLFRYLPLHAQLYPLPSVLSELYPLSCAALSFSFCSVRPLPLIMRSLSLFLLSCLIIDPYPAQPFPFPSVLSELYPLLCAAFPFFFCSVWTSPSIISSLPIFPSVLSHLCPSLSCSACLLSLSFPG